MAQSLGVELWSVPLGSRQRPMDVQLDRVMVPPRVNSSESLAVRVVVSSQQATPAHLLLFRDQTLIGEREIELRPGKQHRSSQIFWKIRVSTGMKPWSMLSAIR